MFRKAIGALFGQKVGCKDKEEAMKAEGATMIDQIRIIWQYPSFASPSRFPQTFSKILWEPTSPKWMKTV